VRGDRRAPSVRAAEGVLWFLLILTVAGGGWRGYQLVTQVRADKLYDFFLFVVWYSALQAALLVLALLWLRIGGLGGRIFSASLLLYFGLRMAWLAYSGGSRRLPTAVERATAVGLQGGVALVLLALAIWLLASRSVGPSKAGDG
jgi:hypothetical protein